MGEQLFALSRLARLDVKWAKQHLGIHSFHDWGHSNPYFELIAVIEGPVYLQVEQEKLELRSGECYLLLPWETHRSWKALPPSAGFFWVQFAADPPLRPLEHGGNLDGDLKIKQLQKQDLRTFSSVDHDPLWIPRRFTPLRRFELLGLFEKLLEGQTKPRGYFRFAATLLLGQMFANIAEELLERSSAAGAIPASFQTYRGIVNYLNEFYSTPITKETMEKQFRRKYEYLCQLFKKYAGMPMVSYIRELRVQRAKHLLWSTSASIGEIAEQVGFSDPYYFSKVFKSIEGQSPNQFRKRRGAEDANAFADGT
ncbi:AraC family transcriptional regulator [Paenibacillus sp. GYB003]|uniref:AraC family transcriptional regulator n=1 Tax=Paenibacillus sp. GYB003 TaxID=2994392 RepID=UPI002F964350